AHARALSAPPQRRAAPRGSDAGLSARFALERAETSIPRRTSCREVGRGGATPIAAARAAPHRRARAPPPRASPGCRPGSDTPAPRAADQRLARRVVIERSLGARTNEDFEELRVDLRLLALALVTIVNDMTAVLIQIADVVGV